MLNNYYFLWSKVSPSTVIIIFARIMMKYILGIVLSTVLMLGFLQKSDAEQQEGQTEVANTTRNVQFCSLSNGYILKDTTKKTTSTGYMLENEMSNSEICECRLTNSTYCRCRIAPFRLLKDYFLLIRHFFKLADVQTIEGEYQGSPFNMDYSRFSNKYYVYALGHILI